MTAGFTDQEDNYGKNEKTKTAEVAVQCSLRRAFYFTCLLYTSNMNKNTVKKMVKKGAKVTLCAALAGGLLLGGYNGISYFTDGVQNVSASSDKTTLTMTKSAKKLSLIHISSAS